MGNEGSSQTGGPRNGRLGRIAVVGTTGSGKTTLARQVAQRLSLPHFELDALNWEANWTQVPREVFRERVAEALIGDVWVADGNYSVVRDIVWARADTIVWLDYSLLVIMVQLLRRTLRRIFTKEELWNGNRERFREQFLSRDSLLLWALQTYRRRRRDYPALFREPEHRHLTVVRLHSPAASRRWLSTVSQVAQDPTVTRAPKDLTPKRGEGGGP